MKVLQHKLPVLFLILNVVFTAHCLAGNPNAETGVNPVLMCQDLDDLIISEVYDNSTGSLGYIEIYNGTGATVVLTPYSIVRYGNINDINPTHTYSFPTFSVGVIADGEVLVGKVGTGAGGLEDFTFLGTMAGFNEGDRLELIRNDVTFNTVVDDFHETLVGARGYNVRRSTTITGANPNYDANEWIASPSLDDTSDLGIYNYVRNTIVADDPADVTVCGSYTLPVLTSGRYWSQPNGGGNALNPGDVITTTQLIYVFAQDATNPACSDENSFTVTIEPGPQIDPINNIYFTSTAVLPPITGTNLSGNESYYTAPGGMGDQYFAGDVIDLSTFPVYPYTLYPYDSTGPNCDDVEAFQLIVLETIAITEWIADPLGNDATDEWVELYNYGVVPVDLQGWVIRDGSVDSDVITNTPFEVAPGDYVILAKNKAAFEDQWLGGCTSTNVLEVPGLMIANAPDELELLDPNGLEQWTVGFIGDQREGFATHYTQDPDYSIAFWQLGGNNGIDRDGIDNSSGNLGYERNNATPDALAYLSTNGDQGSPLQGLERDTQAPVPDPFLPTVITASCKVTFIQDYFAQDNCRGAILGVLNATFPITTSRIVTLTFEDGNGNVATHDIEIQLNATVSLAPIDDVTVCESYQLPFPTGTGNISSVRYFTGPNGTGAAYNPTATVSFADFASYPVTLYARVDDGGCQAETTFELTLLQNTPLDPIADVEACDTYTLPALTRGNYFTGANGSGTALNPGDQITSNQVIFVFESAGGACENEESYSITINSSPSIDSYSDVQACNTHTLPSINGTGLTGNEAYYTGIDGTGVQFNPGDTISLTDFASFPQTIYVYATSGTTSDCDAQESFELNLSTGPQIDPINDVSDCDFFTFPVLQGSNLSGNEAYFTEPEGGGSQYGDGQQIRFTDFPTFPITIYAYDSLVANCSAQESFMLDLAASPEIDPINDINVCNDFTFPEITGSGLSTNVSYFTQSGGNGLAFAEAEFINITQFATYPVTIYVYDQNTQGCSTETSFELTIENGAALFDPIVIELCESQAGATTLDLAIIGGNIAGGNGDLDVTFYQTATDANDAVNPLDNAFSFPAGETRIYVRAEDTAGSCTGFLDFVVDVRAAPATTLLESYELCLDSTGSVINQTFARSGLDVDQYDFSWFLEEAAGFEIISGAMEPDLELLQIGAYRFNATDRDTDCVFEFFFEVNEFMGPNNFGASEDGSHIEDQHVITAFVEDSTSNTGYEARLDDGFWVTMQETGDRYQSIFTNVPTLDGLHTISLRSLDGCWERQINVRVVGVPQFFTPNSDGFNDFWTIPSLVNLDDKATVSIYDRHGKLIKQIAILGAGWNGTYRNEQLPSSDYWYVATYKITDATNLVNEQTIRGHFTLKR
ncbi:MAG: T9SS type B sorting domain-containing protein [Nonlabens sp.]